MNIEELLNKYFEGDTSCAEEELLRDYFTHGEVAPEWMVYKPLFVYFKEEIEKEKALAVPVRPKKKYLLYGGLSGVAAAVLLLIGINLFRKEMDPCLCLENYVVINGRCYTDEQLVRSFAFGALKEVATPTDEYFPEADDLFQDQFFFEEQLKELSDIFNDKD